MSFEEKIAELGIEIPEVPMPLAAYVPAVQAGELIFSSGQLPFVKGELKYKGKLGIDFTVEQGYEAAKACVVNCLAAIKSVIGSLDDIEQVVKLTGYVNSAPGFTSQPLVINGASELLVEIFGEKGKHARAAVGVNELPLGAAAEVEMIVKIKV
ncbi:MAG: RidA family protein [Clostridia bacterium]|nr:RidA family protein [Clostridia bacterium]